MAKRRQGANRAIGGAITPAMPSAPQPGAPISFNQFLADQTPGGTAATPTASPAASNPFVTPPTASVATAAAAATSGPRDPGAPRQGGGDAPTPPTPAPNPNPNPVGMSDPALAAALYRHMYWMRSPDYRGDNLAQYGAGPMRTVAF